MHALASPFARSPLRRFGELVITLLVLAVLYACAGLNPVAVAQTPEQRYDAAILSYEALLAPATEIVEDVGAPPPVRRSLQAAIAESGEIYRTSKTVFTEFTAAKAQVTAAAPGAGARLDVATANLESWIAKLEDVTVRIRKLTK